MKNHAAETSDQVAGKAVQSTVFTSLRRLSVNHPQWPYWVGLCLAFAVLYQRLAAAGEATLQFWFNSDYLFAADLYKDIFIDHFPLSGVKFSTAPELFPDVTFTSVLMFLTHNAILATFLYGLLQFTLLVSAYVFCAALVTRAKRPVPYMFVLSLAVALVLHVSSILEHPYNTLYYLFLSESHVGSFALVLFCGGAGVWLCFHPWQGGRAKVAWGAAAGLALVGTLSNLMFVPHMLVAFTVAVLVMIYRDLLPARRSCFVLLVVWGSSLVGLLLARTLIDSAPLQGQTALGFDRFTAAANTYWEGLYLKVRTGDWLHLVALLWLVVSIGLTLHWIRRSVVLRRDSSEQSEETRRLLLTLLFLMASSVSSAVIIIVLGISGLSVLKNYWWSMHYQYPLFFGSIFGLALLADAALAHGPEGVQRLFHRLSAALAILAPLTMLILSPKPALSLPAYRPSLVEALDGVAPIYGLQYGVGGFWQSRWVNLFSRNGLRLYPILSDLDPQHWLSNKYWFTGYPGSRYARPVYNYIVLDDPLFPIPREVVVKRFGEPAAELKANDVRILVYNRPSDEAFRNFFLCRPVPVSFDHTGDSLELLGSCLPGDVGAVEGEKRVARQGETTSGYLTFGPYTILKTGAYSVQMRCKTSGSPGSHVADWDAGFFKSTPAVELAHGSVRTGDAEMRATFTLSPADAGRPLEMRVFYRGGGDLLIEKLTIERTR